MRQLLRTQAPRSRCAARLGSPVRCMVSLGCSGDEDGDRRGPPETDEDDVVRGVGLTMGVLDQVAGLQKGERSADGQADPAVPVKCHCGSLVAAMAASISAA